MLLICNKKAGKKLLVFLYIRIKKNYNMLNFLKSLFKKGQKQKKVLYKDVKSQIYDIELFIKWNMNRYELSVETIYKYIENKFGLTEIDLKIEDPNIYESVYQFYKNIKRAIQ